MTVTVIYEECIYWYICAGVSNLINLLYINEKEAKFYLWALRAKSINCYASEAYNIVTHLPYLKQINEIVDSCYTCTFFNFLSARLQVVKIVTMVSEDLHRSDAYKFKELFFCKLAYKMINHNIDINNIYNWS